jgi:hypothetical protein
MRSYDIRFATEDDLRRWHDGALPPVSVRAQVIEIDGKLEAIWGVQLTKGNIVAFSIVNKRVRDDKRAVIACMRNFRELLKSHPHVVAYADGNEPTADAFIKHAGFTYAGSSNLGEVYIYV